MFVTLTDINYEKVAGVTAELSFVGTLNFNSDEDTEERLSGVLPWSYSINSE